MIETPLSQGRVEWPIPVRKARRRRDSRVAVYHNHNNTPRLSPRNSTPAPATSPNHETSRSNDPNTFQQSLEHSLDRQFLDFYDFQSSSPTGNSGISPVIHQNGQNQFPWSPSASTQYTFASDPQDYSQVLDGNHAAPPLNGISNDGLDMSWTEANFMNNNAGSDFEISSMSDVKVGSFESFDSLLLATPDTGGSSISEGYNFPGMDSTFGLPETSLDGLKIPDGYFQTTGQALDPSSPGTLGSPLSPDDFQFEGDSFRLPVDWNPVDVYSNQGHQWSSTTLTQPQQNITPQLENSTMIPHNPWNSQQAQISIFQANANTGTVAFEPPRGLSYKTHLEGEEYLENRQQRFGPEAVSPTWETDSGEWTVTSYPSSYAASHNSPRSQGSPTSHASSPVHVEIEPHSHVFSSDSRISKPKATRGRQRNLTTLEKKSAREVREAKACWACHISKTKCSPCSFGKPCEQCTRLVSKRRFCKFTCFNDPLETLHTFLVPDYVMGHITPGNVESFVRKNATSWGTKQVFIQLSWGYRRLLEANVVALALRGTNSDIGVHHQAIPNGSGRPTLIRRQSPPFGIPLADMEEMGGTYSRYIQDIVQSDLRAYVSIAYDDQACMLPENLLGAVCSYYTNRLQANDECSLLRRAIEIHVTSTIIERSLILNTESIERVQNHMQQEYPPLSAPRCAQRQIKLAFFILQRQRIVSVLKDWGNMMWTIHNAANCDRRWATGFSVFVMLTLLIDKTLGSAYYFCENRIEHYGSEAEAERKEFQKLVRLTQTELFERCKEIFHWKFKTRKAGKEACNPIRDGMIAFKSRAVDDGITQLVRDLRVLTGEFDPEIKDHMTVKPQPSTAEMQTPYTDAGRMACIFLDDFVDHP